MNDLVTSPDVANATDVGCPILQERGHLSPSELRYFHSDQITELAIY